MPLPSMEDFAGQFMKALEAFVKQAQEVIEVLIQKLKEFFGGFM
jgi:hypothetical protein